MTKKEASSVELFKKFQPKFREIVWHANGFQGENLLLAPGYLGQEYPIPLMIKKPPEGVTYLLWSDTEAGKKDRRPSFDVREGNLAFNFAFDPSGRETMKDQLEETVMQAICAGPFRGRRFFMRPRFEDLDQCRMFRIPIEFHTDGCGPIPGLRLGEAVVYDWRFFIPDGPERAAIQAAVDLERTTARG